MPTDAQIAAAVNELMDSLPLVQIRDEGIITDILRRHFSGEAEPQPTPNVPGVDIARHHMSESHLCPKCEARSIARDEECDVIDFACLSYLCEGDFIQSQGCRIAELTQQLADRDARLERLLNLLNKIRKNLTSPEFKAEVDAAIEQGE